MASATLSLGVTLATELVGPMVIGTLLNVWLYGALLMQVQTFARNAKDDPTWLKVFVGIVVTIETIHAVSSCYVSYDYAVLDFGNIPKILLVTPEFGMTVLATAISGSLVQGFFGMRIKWLTGRTWLGALIILSAFIQFLCGVGVITAGAIISQFAKFQEFKALVIVWLVAAPVTDILVSVTLVMFLRGKKTGFEVTDSIITKLTIFAVQTGAITAIWATCDLILFLTIDNNLHFIFNFSLSKLYANCLLSSLNARSHWSERSKSQPATLSHSHDGRGGGVKVTTFRGVHHDDDIELDLAGTTRSPYAGTGMPQGFVDARVVDIKAPSMSSYSQPSLPIKTRPMPEERRGTDDGLSLRSESLTDVDIEDDLSHRRTGSVARGGRVTQADRKVGWQGVL